MRNVPKIITPRSSIYLLGSPSLDTLVIIADLFHVSLDDLMGRMEVDMDFHVPDEW